MTTPYVLVSAMTSPSLGLVALVVTSDFDYTIKPVDDLAGAFAYAVERFPAYERRCDPRIAEAGAIAGFAPAETGDGFHVWRAACAGWLLGTGAAVADFEGYANIVFVMAARNFENARRGRAYGAFAVSLRGHLDADLLVAWQRAYDDEGDGFSVFGNQEAFRGLERASRRTVAARGDAPPAPAFRIELVRPTFADAKEAAEEAGLTHLPVILVSTLKAMKTLKADTPLVVAGMLDVLARAFAAKFPLAVSRFADEVTYGAARVAVELEAVNLPVIEPAHRLLLGGDPSAAARLADRAAATAAAVFDFGAHGAVRLAGGLLSRAPAREAVADDEGEPTTTGRPAQTGDVDRPGDADRSSDPELAALAATFALTGRSEATVRDHVRFVTGATRLWDLCPARKLGLARVTIGGATMFARYTAVGGRLRLELTPSGDDLALHIAELMQGRVDELDPAPRTLAIEWREPPADLAAVLADGLAIIAVPVPVMRIDGDDTWLPGARGCAALDACAWIVGELLARGEDFPRERVHAADKLHAVPLAIPWL